jgi:hypothetical protein
MATRQFDYANCSRARNSAMMRFELIPAAGLPQRNRRTMSDESDLRSAQAQSKAGSKALQSLRRAGYPTSLSSQ